MKLCTKSKILIEKSFRMIANEAACRPFFPSRSAKAIELGEVNRWHTSVLTPVNEAVYAKQYENKDAEVQTTYT